jgi:hypothetical protein
MTETEEIPRWVHIVGELLAGVAISLVVLFMAWLKGDTVPLWGFFLCFIIGDLLWWKAARHCSST